MKLTLLKPTTAACLCAALSSLCLLLFLSSCSRIEELCYEPHHPHGSRVKLTTHWPQVFTGDEAVKSDSVYLHLYHSDGTYLSVQTARDEFFLAPGTYHVLATNRHLPEAALSRLEDMQQVYAGSVLAPSRTQTPLYNQAVNLYAAWSTGFTLPEEPVTDTELALTFYPRSTKIRLHITVEGLEHVSSFSPVLLGMAEYTLLVSGVRGGDCRVVPSITSLSDGYRLDATVWGASPLAGQELELSLTLTDGSVYHLITDLTDVFLTLGTDEYEADVYITLSMKQGMEFEAKVNSWKVGGVLHGEVN